MLALVPLSTFAQLQTGYYRVQNYYSNRYVSIVDNEASITVDPSGAGMVNADLAALYMLDDESSVFCNPATICYITINGTDLILEGQGLRVTGYNGSYLRYGNNSDGTYFMYGYYSGSGIKAMRYLYDDGLLTMPGILDKQEKKFRSTDWYVRPVDDTYYFGVKPETSATSDNYYWSTLLAGFPFMASESSNAKMYTIVNVDEANGFAIIKEFEGYVPEEVPVLIRCSSESPSENKMTLLAPTNKTYADGLLKGVYYCNDVAESTGHRNVTAYNSSNMRMLGLSDGKPAFVKSDITYIPANKCYLSVSSSAPDVLKIVTEEEYITGITELTSNPSASNKTIYDLQGRRVTAPSKGLYIVNGKKVVIK